MKLLDDREKVDRTLIAQEPRHPHPIADFERYGPFPGLEGVVLARFGHVASVPQGAPASVPANVVCASGGR